MVSPALDSTFTPRRPPVFVTNASRYAYDTRLFTSARLRLRLILIEKRDRRNTLLNKLIPPFIEISKTITRTTLRWILLKQSARAKSRLIYEGMINKMQNVLSRWWTRQFSWDPATKCVVRKRVAICSCDFPARLPLQPLKIKLTIKIKFRISSRRRRAKLSARCEPRERREI